MEKRSVVEQSPHAEAWWVLIRARARTGKQNGVGGPISALAASRLQTGVLFLVRPFLE